MDKFIQYNLYLGHGIDTPRTTKTRVSARAFLNWLKANVDERFPGYTLHQTMGRWEGVEEPAIVLEIITPASKTIFPDEIPWVIREIAESYKKTFFQDAVLVTVTPVRATFV